MNPFALLGAVVLTALPSLTRADMPSPPLFWAKYTVHANGLKVGEMTRSLKAVGDNRYELQTEAYTTGLVSLFKADRYVERSTWITSATGHTPLEFFSRYTGRSKEVVERLAFDWKRRVVVSLRDGKEKEVGISSGIYDKLSYQVAMRDDLAKGVKTLRYKVADRGKIENYALDVVGEERIATPMGTVRAVKVVKGTTTLWCAVDWDYLPIKLEQHEDTHTLGTYILELRRQKAPASAVQAP